MIRLVRVRSMLRWRFFWLTVRLQDAGGVELGSVRTTADGSYRFAHLQPGTYTVTVVVPDPAEQPGWSKTFGSSSVAVGVDAVVSDAHFGYKIFVPKVDLSSAGQVFDAVGGSALGSGVGPVPVMR